MACNCPGAGPAPCVSLIHVSASSRLWTAGSSSFMRPQMRWRRSWLVGFAGRGGLHGRGRSSCIVLRSCVNTSLSAPVLSTASTCADFCAILIGLVNVTAVLLERPGAAAFADDFARPGQQRADVAEDACLACRASSRWPSSWLKVAWSWNSPRNFSAPAFDERGLASHAADLQACSSRLPSISCVWRKRFTTARCAAHACIDCSSVRASSEGSSTGPAGGAGQGSGAQEAPGWP